MILPAVECDADWLSVVDGVALVLALPVQGFLRER